jgi:hypothetical protein
VISASGSSCSPRSLQSVSAESLPPLHESAKVDASVAAFALGRCDGRGRDSTECPLMKNLLVRRRRRPGGGYRTNRPFLRGLAFVQRKVDLARPRGAPQLRDSAGFAPDFAASHRPGDMCPTLASIRHLPDRRSRLEPEPPELATTVRVLVARENDRGRDVVACALDLQALADRQQRWDPLGALRAGPHLLRRAEHEHARTGAQRTAPRRRGLRSRWAGAAAAELGEDVRDVVLGGAATDHEALRDLLV